ncbi:MAG: hypothetical protein SGBAC_005383 [Bacillariaceae sp.]
MGRKKRKLGQNAVNEEERWKNAVSIPVDGGRSFQVVGMNSPTGTLFLRPEKANDILPLSEKASCTSSSSSSIGMIPSLFAVLERVLAVSLPACRSLSIQELCRLGAIWISTRDKRHPQNPPKWNRTTELRLQQEIVVEDDTIVRIHSRPPRFPSFSKLQVVFKNETHGFWVVNKPGGCPSHATVDNGTENVLAVVQKESSYATLPQRLDTETSGLLLVATRPSFARYMGQLFESKTKHHHSQLEEETNRNEVVESKSIKPLTKKYRCLVVVSDTKGDKELYQKLCRWRDAQERVTHYLDTSSPAPKRFLDASTIIPDEKAPPSEAKKWQLCQLVITSVSQPYPVSVPGGSSDHPAAQRLCESLWGKNRPVAEDPNPMYVLQLEIDLLTGRTHQIRGQLAALGAPIVGDALYGGVDNPNGILLKDSSLRAANRMALQCCSLHFKKPTTGDNEMDEILSGYHESSFYRFQMDQAWWTKSLKRYADEGT